jgi:membrane protein
MVSSRNDPSDRKREMRRGRNAEKPADIPKPGWKDILWRVKDEQSKDNLSIVAGGVAFYAILALFPALAAAVSIYGLMADPADVQNLLKSIAGIMPQEAYQIIEGQPIRSARKSKSAAFLM